MVLNLHIFLHGINSTNSNISSGTFNISSYVNELWDANCEIGGSPWESIWLIFTGRTPRIFLWNVHISLRRRWCYSSWRSKLSTSLCLHSYFISNSIIFYKSDIISSRWHPWWELIDVENFIDVIMTTNKEIFTSIGVLTSSLSDHEQNLLMSLLGATKTITLQNSLRIFNSLLFTW